MNDTIKVAPWLAGQVEELQRDPEFLADDLVMDVCEQICVALDESDMKRKDLADALGVSKSAVSQLLGGDQNISLRRLVEVALAIGDGYTVEPPRLVPFNRPVVEPFEVSTTVRNEYTLPLDQTAEYWKALCTAPARRTDSTEGRWYVPEMPASVTLHTDAPDHKGASVWEEQEALGPSYERAS